MTMISEAEFDRAAELTPRQLVRYLHGRGWSASRGYGRGELWVLPAQLHSGRPTYEVLVPMDRRPRDYADRVADLVETLSLAEGRRPADVLREITLPPADWQYLRLLPPGPSGTAPLVDLVPALTGLKELMTAAAAAALSPQPVQPAQKSQQVKDFVSAVRLDQTRVGSYVIAAHTPIPEASVGEPAQDELPFDDPDDSSRIGPTEPFERLVSRRLYAGVVCAQKAAMRSVREDQLVDFAQFAPAGLSANLCEALVRIAGEERRPYELSFDWTAELPMRQETPPVALPSLLLPALEAGAKDLRERLGRRGAILRGAVVRMRRELGSQWGEVTVQGQIVDEYDSRARRVRMTLDPADYDKAAEAHREGHEVIVRGDLTVQGNRSRMEEIAAFTVLHVND
ncbi:hypothetical protein [Streptomyces sp. NPDC018347]|uniref:hypothetical protein n=1 Tax=Streptomyces sp. NPDC018347 TaxID=3157193 RepID=UPI0033CE8430